MKTFHPIEKSTVSRTVTGTSAAVQIPAAAVGATAMRVVYTAGTASARIKSGSSSGIVAVAGPGSFATPSDMLCPNPGTPFVYAETFSINENDTYVAAITDSGTCTIEFTFGFGQ